MADQRIKFDLFNTYIATIKNSIGTHMFQNIYVTNNGKRVDVANGGEFSCAAFVSAVLLVNENLISTSHATVKSTLEDMQKNGWYKIKELKVGAILVWPPWEEKNIKNWHLGFYIGDEKAISNDSIKTKAPAEHHFTFGEKNGKPVREIDSIWWHDKLSSSAIWRTRSNQ